MRGDARSDQKGGIRARIARSGLVRKKKRSLSLDDADGTGLDGSKQFPKTNRLPPLPVTKRYVLRLFISLKHITANVIDRKTGRVAATASSIEKSLKDGFECGRTGNTKASVTVGEVLAMRLKVDGLHREPIYANAAKEIAKKGFKIESKVWSIFDALRSHGVNLQLDSDDQGLP